MAMRRIFDLDSSIKAMCNRNEVHYTSGLYWGKRWRTLHSVVDDFRDGA